MGGGSKAHRLIHRPTGLSLLEWQIRKWSDHYQQVLVVGPNDAPNCYLKDPEEFSGQGPLAGILAGCKACSSDWLAVLAVDCPSVPPALFSAALAQAQEQDDIVVFRDRQQRIHWLSSLWKRSRWSRIEQELSSGQRAVKLLASKLHTRVLDWTSDNEDQTFRNLNRPSDLDSTNFYLPPVELPKEGAHRDHGDLI